MMSRDLPLDVLFETLSNDSQPSTEIETLEWLAMDESKLRELVRLVLIGDAAGES